MMLDLPEAPGAEARNALFNRGVEHYEQGAVDEALDIFRLLAFLAPGDGGVWRALARCHDDFGHHDAAGQLRELAQLVDEEMTS